MDLKMNEYLWNYRQLGATVRNIDMEEYTTSDSETYTISCS